MSRHIDTLTKTIRNYLERNSLYEDTSLWEIKKSDLGGYGLFARRPIEIGEVIFKDYPIILGPRAALTSPISCINCFKKENLKLCDKLCGLQLCSSDCQNSSSHQKECKVLRQWQTTPILDELSIKLMKVFAPVRSLLLSDEDKEVVKCLKAHKSDQHGFEIDVMKNILHLNLKEDEEDFMRFVCCVMDSNAFEVTVGNEDNQTSVKGLYPLGSLANHSCTPNTTHVFDCKQYMIVRASSRISKNSEIFHSYSRFIWGTPTRRLHLYRTKHFLCKCERCQDPTEFGCYVSAVLCKICKNGRVISMNSLISNEKWQCECCGVVVDKKDIAAITSLLGSALNSFDDDEVTYMVRFIQIKLPSLVPENNEAVVELKYKLIWILGYQKDHTWSDLSNDLLHLKEQFCRDLLVLLEKLKLGQCKMRGLLLHELCNCLKELKLREGKSGMGLQAEVSDQNMRNLMLEAADILMYDVGAPSELKAFWPKH